MPLNAKIREKEQKLLTPIQQTKQTVQQPGTVVQQTVSPFRKTDEKTAYQKNLEQPVQMVSLYNDHSDYSKTLRKIYQASDGDPEKRNRLMSTFTRLIQDPNSQYYQKFAGPTNRSVFNLAEYGVDTSVIDDDFYARNDYLRQYLNYDGTTNTPTKPGAKASDAEKAAYEYYQIWKSEDATKKAETQWQALQDELRYWAKRRDLNYSDDEIIDRIDWSKYGALADMDTNTMSPAEYNRAIGYSKDAMYGVLWEARNPEYQGDLYGAIANSALLRGNIWHNDDNISAKRNWNDRNTYDRYALGMTLDDAGMYFNEYSFDQHKINKIRSRLDTNDGTAVSHFQKVVNAEKTTKDIENELSSINEKIDKWIAGGRSEEWIMTHIDKEYEKLTNVNKLVASLEDTEDKLIPTTRAIKNYRKADIKNVASEKWNAVHNNAVTTNNFADDMIGGLAGNDNIYGMGKPLGYRDDSEVANPTDLLPIEGSEEQKQSGKKKIPIIGGKSTPAQVTQNVPNVYREEQAANSINNPNTIDRDTALSVARGDGNYIPGTDLEEEEEKQQPGVSYLNKEEGRDSSAFPQAIGYIASTGRPTRPMQSTVLSQETDLPPVSETTPAASAQNVLSADTIEKEQQKNLSQMAPDIDDVGTVWEKILWGAGRIVGYDSIVERVANLFDAPRENILKQVKIALRNHTVSVYPNALDTISAYEDLQSELKDKQEELKNVNFHITRLSARQNVTGITSGFDKDFLERVVASPGWETAREQLLSGDPKEQRKGYNYIYMFENPDHTGRAFEGSLIDKYPTASLEELLEAEPKLKKLADIAVSGQIGKESDFEPLTVEEEERLYAFERDRDNLEIEIDDLQSELDEGNADYLKAQSVKQGVMSMYKTAQRVFKEDGIRDNFLTALEYASTVKDTWTPYAYPDYSVWDELKATGKAEEEIAPIRSAVINDRVDMISMLGELLEYHEGLGLNYSDEEMANIRQAVDVARFDLREAVYSSMDTSDPEFTGKAISAMLKGVTDDMSDLTKKNVSLLLNGYEEGVLSENAFESLLDSMFGKYTNSDDPFFEQFFKSGGGYTTEENAIQQGIINRCSEEITDVEKFRYFYLLAEDGEEAANEYFQHLVNPDYGTLMSRVLNKETQSYQDFTDDGGWGTLIGYLASFPMNFVGNIQSIITGFKDRAEGKVSNPEGIGYLERDKATALRAGVTDYINKNYDKESADVLNFLLNAMTSSGDSLLNAVAMNTGLSFLTTLGEDITWLKKTFEFMEKASAGDYGGAVKTTTNALNSWAHATLMAAGAGEMAYQKAIKDGASIDQANAMRRVTFFAESVSEAITFGNINKMWEKGSKGSIINLFRELFVNGMEEAVGEGFNQWWEDNAETVIMDNLSTYKQMVTAMKNAGVPESLAIEEANKQMAKNIMIAAGSGFISSVGSSTSSYVAGAVNQQLVDEQQQKQKELDMGKLMKAEQYVGVSEIDGVYIEKTNASVTISSILRNHLHQKKSAEVNRTNAAGQYFVSEINGGDSANAIHTMQGIVAASGTNTDAAMGAVTYATLTKGDSNRSLLDIVRKAKNGEGITEQDVNNLIETVNTEQAGENAQARDVEQESAVKEFLVATEVMTSIATNSAKSSVNAIKAAETTRDNAFEANRQAKVELRKAQDVARAKADAVTEAANAVTQNPTDENRRALNAAIDVLNGASVAETQAQQHLEKTQTDLDNAQNEYNKVRGEQLGNVRTQAEATVEQRQQETAQQEAQEEEQARIDAEVRAKVEDELRTSNNVTRMLAKNFVEKYFPDATDEQRQRIYNSFNRVRRELGMTSEGVLERMKFAKQIGKKFGYEILILDTTVGKDGKKQARRNASINGNRIILDRQATMDDLLYTILPHEITHDAENSATYKSKGGLADTALQIMYGDDVSYQGVLQELESGNPTSKLAQDVLAMKKRYDRQLGKEHSYEDALKEVVADAVGSVISGDQATIDRLVQQPSVARRVIESIKSFLRKMAGIENPQLTQAQNVVDMLENALKNKDKQDAEVKNSLADQQYNEAVESGDTETEQRMVDEAAENAMPDSKVRDTDGKLLRVYHGTQSEFNEFMRDKIGSTGRFEGSGFNFTPYEGRASSYGKNVLSGYLNITNPLSAKKKTISVAKLAQIIRKADPTGDNIIADYARNTNDYGKESFVRRESMTAARAVWDASDNDVDIYSFISAADSDAESLINTFESLGYDGLIHYDDNGKIKTVVAFNSNQFKKADPVTYDDKGKVIPIGKRFNPQNKDIRYSIPEERVAQPDVETDSGEALTGTIDNDTEVKYSLSSWTDAEIKAVRKNILKHGFTQKDADKWIADVNSIAAVIAADKDRLDFIPDRDQKFKKPNGDVYKWTLDASTLCAKRLLYQGTFNKIQEQLPNIPLRPGDLIELANMMHEMGYQTPCGICYVESRRRHLGNFTEEFLADYQGEYKPTYAELTSTDGLAKLKQEHRQAYDDYIAAMNGKGVASPKVVQLRTDYRGDVRNLNKDSIAYLNSIGGLRIQSFSDFETPHLMDMMQAAIDMAAVKLKSQAYTKVPNFAWVFGDTGIKINLSLMGEGKGVDANGNLIFSNTEGMDFVEAMKLRNRYSKNVGTILVGMNDEHIIAAMGDDRIDYIIPFHKSGWSQEELDKMTTLANYTDYQDTQNELWIVGQKEDGSYITKSIDKKTGNLDPYGEDGYWEYNKSGQYNAEKYLKLCAQQKRLPKFSQFLVDNGDGTFSLPKGTDQRSTNIREGYWKTLIDFKMYENDGSGSKGRKVKGAPQQAVTPNINMPEAYRVLKTYEAPEGGNNALPSADPVVERFVEYMKQKGNTSEEENVKYSLPSDQELDDWFDQYIDGMSAEELDQLSQELFGIPLSTPSALETTPATETETAPAAEPVNDQLPENFREAYKDAIKSGDLATARNIIDKLAKKAGYTVKGTHRTNAQFTVFDKSKQSGKNGKSLGDGFYVAAGEGTEYDTNAYGKNRMLVYINPGNVFNLRDGLTAEEAQRVYDEYFAPYHPMAVGDNPYTAHVLKQLQNPNKVIDYIKEAAENAQTTTDEVFKWLGYNSVKDGPQYVVFDPEQIKSADLFTYNDQNEMIEADERFNQNEPDIRYSLPEDSDYLTAVDRGDMEEAQRLVDEEAQKYGYTLTAYHGTGEYFTVFNRGAEGIHIGNLEQASQVANDRYEYRSKDTHYKWSDLMNRMSEIDEKTRRDLVGLAYTYQNFGLRDEVESVDRFSGDINDDKAVIDYVDNILKGQKDREDPGETMFLLPTFDRKTGKNIMNLYAKINNPFVINGDISLWSPDRIADLLMRRAREEETFPGFRGDVNITGSGINPNSQQWNLLEKIQSGELDGDEAWDALSYVLKQNGYDGIKYLNTYEGDRNSYSYIALKQSDVKSADPVTYDNDGDVIPLSSRFNQYNNDIRYNLPDSDSLLDEQVTDFLYSLEDDETIPGLTAAETDILNQSIGQNEGDSRRQWGDNLSQESDELAEQAKKWVHDHNLYYKDSNAAQLDRAIDWIRSLRTPDDPTGYHAAMMEALDENFDYRTADGQARMIAMMGMAVAKGDIYGQIALADAYNKEGTEIGQALQARKMFRLMTPVGRKKYLDNMLKNLQKQVDRRKLNADLKLSDWIMMAAELAENENEFEKVRDAAADELSEQIPANWKDKLRTWRMLAMLLNPKTHVRNFVGNMLFVPTVSIKNKLSAIGENLFNTKERTKTLSPVSSKEVRDFSRQVAKDNEDLLRGESKYGEDVKVMRNRKIFGTGKSVVSKTAGRLLQTLSDFNSKALEGEDWFFLKGHFRRAFGGWMMANGYTVDQVKSNPELMEKGKEYAVNEAQKATYRDFNEIAKILNNATMNAKTKWGKALGLGVDALLPFKKTPANILRRGLEYSPLGLVKSITTDLIHLKDYMDFQKGKVKTLDENAISPTQWIDNLCSGLTGTATMALGMVLSHAGIITVKLNDDDDEFEKLKGNQNYSIKIGGIDVTYTLDWAVPTSMPLFVGAAVEEEFEKEGDVNISELVNAALNIGEPFTNLSMIEGISSTFKTSQSEDTDTLTQIFAKIASNYVTSYVPSVLGAAARIADPYKRKAYVKSGEGSGVLGTFRYALEQTENKIPGLSKNNIPVRDAFGRAKENGNSLERHLMNLLSPGTLSRIDQNDPVINELEGLYIATGDRSTVPSMPQKYFNVKGEKITLTDRQYDQLTEDRGTTFYSVFNDLMQNKYYQKSDPAARVLMMKDAWTYATANAKYNIDKDADVDSWVLNSRQNPVQGIVNRQKDRDKSSEKNKWKEEAVTAVASRDYLALETAIMKLEDLGVKESSVKTYVGNAYKADYIRAYQDDDWVTMNEIESILIDSDLGFDDENKSGMNTFDIWIDEVENQISEREDEEEF